MPLTDPGDEPVRLDVRGVAPKDRFALIMDAYDRLAPAQSMELTVDHDPRCMYYTLLATRGRDRFSFEYLEEGPHPGSPDAPWRVRVGKGTTLATLAPPHARHSLVNGGWTCARRDGSR